MKKIVSFIFSMFFTGLLLIIFAISIGYATFVENDFGTTTAKILIYNSWWFEVLLVIIVINLVGSIFINKLANRKKWTIFLFHGAFVFILAGAAITRYYGYEGSMHIREGESSNLLTSEETYVTITASEGGSKVISEKEVKFSGYTGNQLSETLSLNGKNIQVTNLHYVPSAIETIIDDFNGVPMIALLGVTSNMERTDFTLKKGQAKTIGSTKIGFESNDPDVRVNLTEQGGTVYVNPADSIMVQGMSDINPQVIYNGNPDAATNQKIYQTGSFSFVFKQYHPKGRVQLSYSQPDEGVHLDDAFLANVNVNGVSDEVVVYGSKGSIGSEAKTNVGGVEISISYGSKNIVLPFSIFLKDFQLERYPGSNSPSSYASEVILRDNSKNIEKPFRIFMNNILKYNGFRFFQSSYDTDELGTVLSVNHDKAGTTVTYLGYILLALGMVLTLFNKNSRFKKLMNASAKLREERAKLFVTLILGFLTTVAVSGQTTTNQDYRYDKEHIKEFSSLLVQSRAGRIEPVNTLASEVLRKVAKRSKYEGIPASEVLLDMVMNPDKWKSMPFIKVGDSELRKFLGASEKFVSFNQIVISQEMSGYKLASLVQEAYSKNTTDRNKFDKEVINVDERVNILMNIFSGNFLAVFPIPGHENDKWAPLNNLTSMDEESAKWAQSTLDGYFSALANGIQSGDWRSANGYLKAIKDNQEKYGGHIIPSGLSVRLEIFYNNFDIFGKLSKFYLLAGFFLLVLEFLTIFKQKMRIEKLKKAGVILALAFFAFHTFGLAIRWYITGHAPWSNGYESMVFIAWATALAGLVFINRSKITLSLTLVLSGFALMVASMSWMNPELTNLVPVLKSYWLIIHVAIITSSYGFLGICALLGMLNLILMVLRTDKNAVRINFTISELSVIIQMAMIIGLYMITIGSFLGGVWANESWGRYWGWDPKETWALVTVLVYAFIVHMHHIPGFRGNFALSTAALLGFSTVLMTYFGVNYYLSGLHSYAQGEPAPIPTGVYIAIILVAILIVAAFISDRMVKNKAGNPATGLEN